MAMMNDKVKTTEIDSWLAGSSCCRSEDGKTVVLRVGDKVYKPISNRFPKVTSYEIVYILSDNGQCKSERHIKGYLVDPEDGSRSKEFDINLDHLSGVKFQDYDSNCYIYMERYNRIHFEEMIKFQISKMKTTERWVCGSLGGHEIRGQRIYCAGTKIIGETDLDIGIDPSLSQYRLERDTDITEEQKEVHMSKLLNLHPKVTAIAVVTFLISLIRSFFVEAGVPIKFSLYLTGENQSFKTTIAWLCCRLYNRISDQDAHMHSFTSTEAALFEAAEVERDCCCIIDDLNEADSESDKRRQERILSVMTRVASNQMARETKRYCNSINGLLVLTGEYMLKTVSTNNRLVIVECKKEFFDKKKLAELQRSPGILSACAEEFIEWAMANHDWIVEFIRVEHEMYMHERGQEELDQERLAYSGFILNLGFHFFLEFCTKKEWDIEMSSKDFANCVDEALSHQIEIANLDGQSKPDVIFELYLLLKQDIEKCPSKGKAHPNKNNRVDFYRDKEKGLLCFRSAWLYNILQTDFGWELKPRLGMIMKEFDREGLLYKHDTAKKQLVVHISAGNYYMIREADWLSYVDDYVAAQTKCCNN